MVALVVVLSGVLRAAVILPMVALVIVRPGSASIGRCPSATPRCDSGNTRNSDASRVPSACGTDVTATYMPGWSWDRLIGARTLTRTFGLRRTWAAAPL